MVKMSEKNSKAGMASPPKVASISVEEWRSSWITEVDSMIAGLWHTMKDNDFLDVKENLSAVKDIIERTVF